jgi:hypothetical protein
MGLNCCWVLEKVRLKVIRCADVYRSLNVPSLEFKREAAINNLVSPSNTINYRTFFNELC